MLKNWAIHAITKIIKNVMSSAAAEMARELMNTKEAVPLRLSLQEMGHTQEATEVVKDNSTASKFLNNTCKQIRSTVIDMRYYQARNRLGKKEFKVILRPAIEYFADYFTKHHSPAHQKRMRKAYVYVKKHHSIDNSKDVLIGLKNPKRLTPITKLKTAL